MRDFLLLAGFLLAGLYGFWIACRADRFLGRGEAIARSMEPEKRPPSKRLRTPRPPEPRHPAAMENAPHPAVAPTGAPQRAATLLQMHTAEESRCNWPYMP